MFITLKYLQSYEFEYVLTWANIFSYPNRLTMCKLICLELIDYSLIKNQNLYT